MPRVSAGFVDVPHTILVWEAGGWVAALSPTALWHFRLEQKQRGPAQRQELKICLRVFDGGDIRDCGGVRDLSEVTGHGR